ncbi:RNA methyltransferase, TrmH family [Lachnospiraceae bacterium C10]|nr:RNA methyltransferase, TrmH family [Lachnospiraceae bacterium C10]
MITSRDNPRVKHVKKLNRKAKSRRQEKLFVAEGERIISETPFSLLRELYVCDTYQKQEAVNRAHSRMQEKLGAVMEMAKEKGILEVVTEDVFAEMSDTEHPQGVLAVIEQPSYQLKDLMTDAPLLMILEDIQDPGNLGTIFRTAEGAGVSGIIMSRGTVDLFSPKVVRSTMGSIYRMPFLVAEDLPEMIRSIKGEGVRLYAAHLEGKQYHDGFAYTGPSGFMIGNEGNGLSRELTDYADDLLRIPMGGQLESLNAAMAAGILMYEANRQRRKDLGHANLV